MTEVLKSIQARVQTIDETYLNQVCPKLLVTLIVEHFNSKMREVHDVPSVLQYAHQFPAAVEETVKRATQCGFNYFTNPRSYYEVPDGLVSFGDLPKLPWPPKHPGTTQELTELRKWTQEYGKATRQLSVRAKSTKDNPGTLPISAYGRRLLTANPSSCLVELRNSLASQGSSSSESDSADTTEDCGSISLNLLAKDPPSFCHTIKRASGMFSLGVLARDWRPKKKQYSW